VGKPVIGFAMFAMLGFGLGFPYLVALNALPRPGEWMVHVKRAMGFVLVATAFYFLRSIVGEEVFRWGVAASLLIGAVFLFLVRGSGGRALRIAFAVALLIGGAAFAWPHAEGAHVEWAGYDAGVIASAHKPVIIDFYADWCIPCKELDQKTFGDAAVARELGRFVRVKANLTNDKDPKVQQLTKDYSIIGVPTIVLLDASGKETQSLRLTGFEAPGEFLKRLQQVR
jgi:thiol:disulfide interchange protein DsbD